MHLSRVDTTSPIPPLHVNCLPSSGIANMNSDLEADAVSAATFEGKGGLKENDSLSCAGTVHRWNKPSINRFRTIATFWSLFILGANDAALGALLPSLEKYYHLSDAIVALGFLAPVVGYTISALINQFVHHKFGLRGVAIIGPICQIVSYMAACFHPPFIALVFVLSLSGLGGGLLDAAWNAWVGNMSNVNEVLGFLHGFYGLGATVSPIIATAVTSKFNLPWYNFYYMMLSLAIIELVMCVWTFWGSRAESSDERNEHGDKEECNNSITLFKQALTKKPWARIVWLMTLFIITYVGTEVAMGGWIVTFMIRVRGGTPFASGMSATGFWLGLTVGRFILGFVTPRVGETLSISIYLPIVMGLHLLFWLVPKFLLSAVAVSLQGFFLGPMFPAAIAASTKLLPRRLHVSIIGFAVAFGSVGAGLFPFMVGAIAQKFGVQVLQPVVLGMLVVTYVFWLALPKIPKSRL